MHKKQIIYIMGAGRSGTTALATFLGNNSEIINLGEMHQYFEHILVADKYCACGAKFVECEFWKKKNSGDIFRFKKRNSMLSVRMESHSSILMHLTNSFNAKENKEYSEIHQSILNSIYLDSRKSTLLDSSKYIGRVLALNKLENIDLRVIYIVRDIRGVINSFSKKVQTSKSPLSTILYYLLVNSVAEFVSRFILGKKVIKIRYEDLIRNPVHLFDKLEKFLNIDLADIKIKIKKEEAFKIGHIIGGNRLKNNKEIYFRKDISWNDEFSWLKRVVFYVLAFPIMILNKYKL